MSCMNEQSIQYTDWHLKNIFLHHPIATKILIETLLEICLHLVVKMYVLKTDESTALICALSTPVMSHLKFQKICISYKVIELSCTTQGASQKKVFSPLYNATWWTG